MEMNINQMLYVDIYQLDWKSLVSIYGGYYPNTYLDRLDDGSPAIRTTVIPLRPQPTSRDLTLLLRLLGIDSDKELYAFYDKLSKEQQFKLAKLVRQYSLGLGALFTITSILPWLNDQEEFWRYAPAFVDSLLETRMIKYEEYMVEVPFNFDSDFSTSKLMWPDANAPKYSNYYNRITQLARQYKYEPTEENFNRLREEYSIEYRTPMLSKRATKVFLTNELYFSNMQDQRLSIDLYYGIESLFRRLGYVLQKDFLVKLADGANNVDLVRIGGVEAIADLFDRSTFLGNFNSIPTSNGAPTRDEVRELLPAIYYRAVDLPVYRDLHNGTGVRKRTAPVHPRYNSPEEDIFEWNVYSSEYDRVVDRMRVKFVVLTWATSDIPSRPQSVEETLSRIQNNVIPQAPRDADY